MLSFYGVCPYDSKYNADFSNKKNIDLDLKLCLACTIHVQMYWLGNGTLVVETQFVYTDD
jgi:hypothetical protein